VAILSLYPPATAGLAMAAWLAMVCAVSVPGLSLAARAIGPRRENLALVAQGR